MILAPSAPGTGRGGSGVWFEVEDVDAAYAERTAEGFAFNEEPFDIPPGKLVTINDPDGKHHRPDRQLDGRDARPRRLAARAAAMALAAFLVGLVLFLAGDVVWMLSRRREEPLDLRLTGGLVFGGVAVMGLGLALLNA